MHILYEGNRDTLHNSIKHLDQLTKNEKID